MRIRAFARRLAWSALLLSSAASVFADVYGSISGVVRDSSGAPLPGVTISVTAPVLPQGRDTVTQSSGNYTFQNLPPATYTVTAALSGLGSTRATVAVSVDKDSTLNLTLNPKLSETITVSSAAPVVDMKSTEVNYNYDAQTISKLPLPRTYQGLFQLAPGVAAGTGFAPVAGGGRQENNFLLDGVSVTNPLFGYVGIGNTDANELDIQDVNIKRAGFSAEFGRSTGMVVNAVTKSGTNEFQGAVRQEMQPGSWTASAKDPNFNANTDRSRTALSLGGPLWRDHLFAYGSGRYETINTTGRVNYFGPVPDEKQSIKELFGKITATPTQSQYLSIGYRHIPLNDPHTGVGTYDLPEVAFDFKNTNRIGTLDYNWNATKNTVVEAKVLTSSEANHFVAETDLGFKPSFNPANIRKMGAVSIPDPNGSGRLVNGGAYYVRLSTQDYKRNEEKAAISKYFDFAGMNHQVKAGVGYEYGEEHLSRLSNGWGQVADLGTTYRANYYPDQPALLSFGRTYSIYAQDSITVTPRLNVDAGILSNRDEFGEKGLHDLTFLTFNFGQQIQPRLGVNYNLRENTGDKIYANYGRYSNMDQKSTARGLAPYGLVLSTAIFDKATGALVSDKPRSGSTGNAVILSSTKPTYTDEYLLGYSTPFASLWAIDTFGMFRSTHRFIEDYPSPYPDGDFFASNIPAARRYYGITTDISRRLANKWSADFSYTWSRLYGNYDFDVPGGGGTYNTASAIQDGPGIMTTDPYRWGPLLQNRTHVVKAFVSYEVIPNLNLGGFYRFQSGAPWNALGRDVPYEGFRRYLNAVGTYHTPSWSNVDLSASYALPLSRGIRATFEARVLNALNKQTVLTVDRRQYFDTAVETSTPPYYIAPQGTTQPNPLFGTATSYADPRRYIASVRLDF